MLSKLLSRMNHAKARLSAAVICVLLAGCASIKWGFPYKAPIQQGNWITSEQVSLLQPGMSRDQVVFALGSPTLADAMHADRWDYPYYFKTGYGDPVERKFTVFFDNEQLVRWDGDQQPYVQPYQTQPAPAANPTHHDLLPVEPVSSSAVTPEQAPTLP